MAAAAHSMVRSLPDSRPVAASSALPYSERPYSALDAGTTAPAGVTAAGGAGASAAGGGFSAGGRVSRTVTTVENTHCLYRPESLKYTKIWKDPALVGMPCNTPLSSIVSPSGPGSCHD